MNRGTLARPLCAAVIGCWGGWLLMHEAYGQSSTMELDLGAEHSDNIGRVATGEESDTIGIAGVAFGLEQVRPRLETRIGADLQYRRYFDDTFDNEVLGGLSTYAGWSILPERFVWVVEDNYGQIAGNRQQPDTPDNREDFNYFSTGPDLTIPVGARTAIELSGRWSDIYYETSDQGSENVEGSAALARQFSQESTLSLNGSVEDIKYDEEQVFEDYRITEGFLRLETIGGRMIFSADAGYTEAKRGEQSSDGALVRLHLSREITSRTTLGFDAGSEFADTATAFRLDQIAIGVRPDTQDAVASTDVFRATYAYLTLSTERERTLFSVAVNARKERHETETLLDRDALGGGITWSRRLSSRLDLDVRAAYTDEKFVFTDFSFDEWTVGAGLGWRFTPSVAMRMTFDHTDSTSDGGVRDYEENIAYVGIRYSVGRRGR